ncbi:thiaminase /4-amino-5-aminomethyl-2-methylpyrimidine deaminase [Maribacter caenipelagi]|uniref:Aminopyrimidine aminohydrolase n=1 Tax=Maribacter caenipelagi TaxID=1447781 RepID=A0A4R7D3Z8_9FLAO|nr:thiaminase II [Maribacter caenipelagi]TDS15042.1 thiaminase /4-amino-5-aminomethyl-2-methylpyrimidine deaminase [Maribacter caenipelagi]
MQDWYKLARQRTDHILEAIKQQPFIKELMNGTLPSDIFQFYIHQDAMYLAAYKKVLASVGVKCEYEDDTQFFLDSATGIIHVENALHQIFLKENQLVHEPSPTCELYTSYLSRIVANHSLEEALAAVLPCFTIYKEIGDYIQANQTNKENNPFQDWIDTYGGEEFASSVNNAIAITNKYAANASEEVLAKMETAFTKASKLEWMFWNSAYTKEAWKI